jgi:hypothetical protein
VAGAAEKSNMVPPGGTRESFFYSGWKHVGCQSVSSCQKVI